MGRSSVVSFSFKSTPRSSRVRAASRIEVSTTTSRSPPRQPPPGDDHVHAGAGFLVALEARIVERHAGGIGAQTLPGFHLAQVATFGDLLSPIDHGQRMNGCKARSGSRRAAAWGRRWRSRSSGPRLLRPGM